MQIDLKNTDCKHARAFHDGKEKGFDFFFRELFPSLCFFANRLISDSYEAEDIASNAFIKIWKRHFQFDSSAGIRSYLYQIVRNDCLKHIQRESKNVIVKNELTYIHNIAFADEYKTDIVSAEVMGMLYKNLNELPDKCRIIFKMLYVEGKSTREIAHELKITPSTIRTQKARGIAILKRQINLVKFVLVYVFLNLLGYIS